MSIVNIIFTIIILAAIVHALECNEVETYDKIILGSGSAGSVIAGRLSENPANKVLVLERGQESPFIRNPYAQWISVPSVNSVVPPVPVQILPGIEEISTYEPLLKQKSLGTVCPNIAGGGPTVSGSFWGIAPESFDEFAELTGDNRLKYINISRFFKLTENVSVEQSNSTDRGRNGPIQITILDPNDPDVKPIAERQANVFNVSIGIDYISSKGIQGIWPMQRSLLREPNKCNKTSGPCVRQSAYDTYVKPFINTRHNLQVMTESTAIKIEFETDRRQMIKAEGVRYIRNGKTYYAKLRRNGEIIVSMGTINSAKILQLSGIGDETFLRDKGISVIKHLPGVGKNLKDHAVLSFLYHIQNVSSIQHLSSVRIGFFQSPYNNGSTDIEIAWGLLPTQYVIPGKISGVALLGYIAQVRNTGDGELSVSSSSFSEKPNMQFNFDPNRLDPMIWALRKLRDWLRPIGIEKSPSNVQLPFDASDETIRTFLSNYVKGWYHMVGTCKMGKITDPMAVVDTEFKVFGIKNLRVVDNSVQPQIVPIHPSATASTLGELASYYMSGDYS